jgi:nucleoside-diphosphate-sugar epimerase
LLGAAAPNQGLGCPQKFPFLLAAAGGKQKEEKRFFGDTPNPGRGWQALCTPSFGREKMRCLVTGIAGFIGSHLAERLLAEGHEVIGIDCFTDFYPRVLKEQNLLGPRSWKRFSFLEVDLCHPLSPALLEGVQWIFHQAAQAGVRTSWGQHFRAYTNNNIVATQNLLELASGSSDLQRFVYASSSSIYGENHMMPLVETALPRPYSPYGVTKLAAEHLCMLYYRNLNVPTVSLRYFSVYGPRQRPDMAFARFCTALLRGEPLILHGDGRQTRDFTYVSDIVEANLLAATVPEAVGGVFNIAGGTHISLIDTLPILQNITHRSPQVLFGQKQQGDVPHTYANIQQAKQVLGYNPCIDIYQGLEREFSFIQSHLRLYLYSAR